MFHISRYVSKLFTSVLGGVCVVFATSSLYAQSLSHYHSFRKSAYTPQSLSERGNALVGGAMRQLDSLQYFVRHTHLTDSLSNPYLVSVVGNPSLYPQSVHRMFSLSRAKNGVGESETLSFAPAYFVTKADSMLLYACLQYPKLALSPAYFSAERPQKKTALQPELTLTEHFKTPPPPSEDLLPPVGDDLGIVVRKPNFWNFKTNFSLQFTQNYVSDNWYKGGESHNSLLASTVIEANYNNQRKLTFNNKLEMKLGFQSSHNDEEHKYKTNSDLLRLTNKLGVQAVKNWYYTLMLQSWTQFYKGYKANDPQVYSDFMSPFESLLSVGMDYQFTTKNKKFKVNATLSPIALKLKHVSRSSLVTTFGISEGHHNKWEYGSNVTVNYTWQIVRNVSWTGRIYYFTDYSSTQLEWENTFNLSINRYLSARVFLYPRFDDSRTRTEGQSDFEFNELLSLGLNVDF